MSLFTRKKQKTKHIIYFGLGLEGTYIGSPFMFQNLDRVKGKKHQWCKL